MLLNFLILSNFIYDPLNYHFINSQKNDFKNIILYGPSGVGKYTQALKIIHHYYETCFKYDKKISINTDKTEKKSKTYKADDTKKKNNKIISISKKADN